MPDSPHVDDRRGRWWSPSQAARSVDEHRIANAPAPAPVCRHVCSSPPAAGVRTSPISLLSSAVTRKDAFLSKESWNTNNPAELAVNVTRHSHGTTLPTMTHRAPRPRPD